MKIKVTIKKVSDLYHDTCEPIKKEIEKEDLADLLCELQKQYKYFLILDFENRKKLDVLIYDEYIE